MKKLGITLALAAMLALPAAARVRFGVSVGPAYPYSTYCDPYYGCYPSGPYVYYGGGPYYWHGHYYHHDRHYRR
jgi:hypothetical protein